MKKNLFIVGCALAGAVALTIANLGNAAAPSLAQDKEAVAKVLETHHFTPPVKIDGVASSWFVACRPSGPERVEQLIIEIKGGAGVKVSLQLYQHTSGKWLTEEKPKAIDDLQHLIQETITTELKPK